MGGPPGPLEFAQSLRTKDFRSGLQAALGFNRLCDRMLKRLWKVLLVKYGAVYALGGKANSFAAPLHIGREQLRLN